MRAGIDLRLHEPPDDQVVEHEIERSRFVPMVAQTLWGMNSKMMGMPAVERPNGYLMAFKPTEDDIRALAAGGWVYCWFSTNEEGRAFLVQMCADKARPVPTEDVQ